MTREEALEAQATLRTLNEWMMEMYAHNMSKTSDAALRNRDELIKQKDEL